VVDRYQEALEVTDAEVAEINHMLWLNRTQWADHLRGCNLRHLIPASPLPDREEKILQRAVELNSLCNLHPGVAKTWSFRKKFA
jgi:hypothetical protein